MPPVRPLIDFLRSVAAEPSEHHAFRADPEGYLSANGYEGIHRDDATDAMSLVMDTLPAAEAAHLGSVERTANAAFGFEPGPGLDDFGHALPSPFQSDSDLPFGLDDGHDGDFGLAPSDDIRLDEVAMEGADGKADDAELDEPVLADELLDLADFHGLVESAETARGETAIGEMAIEPADAGVDPFASPGSDLDVGAF